MDNRTCNDAQGHPGVLTFATVTACLVCGQHCAVRVDGYPLHPPCFAMTTAEVRRLWVPPSQSQPNPTPAQSPAPGQQTTTPQGPAAGRGPEQPGPPPARKGTPLGERATSSRPTTKTQPKAAPIGHPVPAAAVVDLEETFTTDGRTVATPEISHLGELVEFARSLELGMPTAPYGSAIGQVWITGAAAAAWGMDLSPLAETPGEKLDEPIREITCQSIFVQAAAALGWCTSGAGEEEHSLGRWSKVWHEDEPDRSNNLRVVLVPAVAESGEPFTQGEPSARELAQRIGHFASALRFPYRMSPPATGFDLMTKKRQQRDPELFAPSDPIPPAQISTLEGDFNWTRKPTKEESAHRFVHAYDRSGSYLASADTEMGTGTPQHHPDGLPFNPKTIGYWLVEVPESGDWRVPHPLNARGRDLDGDPVWVTTPSLAIAYEMGLEADVLEAWTWPGSTRALGPWYEQIRDARMHLIDAAARDPQAAAALDALKAVYTRTIGMMGSHALHKGKEGYAPERRHLIIAKANANILRRVRSIGEATGRWPLAIQTDTVLYSSDEEDPAAAWPLAATPEAKQWYGRGLGEYKHEATGLMADQVEYLTGGRWEGKDALMGRER